MEIKEACRIIIPNNIGEILIQQRASKVGFGKWELPGGKVDQGDSLEETLHKELMEEQGLEIKSFEEFAQNTFIYKNQQFTTHYVIAIPTHYNNEPNKTALKKEVQNSSWIKENLIEHYSFAFGNDSAIRNYFNYVSN